MQPSARMWNTCWNFIKGVVELTAEYKAANLGAAFDVIKVAGDLATGSKLSAAMNAVSVIIKLKNAKSDV